MTANASHSGIPTRTDIKPEGIPTEMPLAAIKIETAEHYEKAAARIAELARHVEDSVEERELAALVDAVTKWANR